MRNAEFSRSDLMVTDIGPECYGCDQTLWLYAVNPACTDDPDGRWYVAAQCACCHRSEGFYTEPKTASHVATVRAAHHNLHPKES